MSKIEVSVIIPILNEAQNISSLTQELDQILKNLCKDYEIIFIDDSSQDDSDLVLENLRIQYQSLRFFVRSGNRSLSESVLLGVSKSRGETLVIMDGDGQHDPKFVPVLLDKIHDGYDICIGSRYSPNGLGFGKEDFLRKYISLTMTVLTKLLLKNNIFDPLSGYFCCKKYVFTQSRHRLSGLGYKILLELIFYGRDLKIMEIPITFRKRTNGSSKASISVFYFFVCQIISLITGIKSIKFISYCLVGSVGIITHLFFLNLIFAVNNNFLLSNSIAFIFSAGQNYLLNKKFTFNVQQEKKRTTFFEIILYYLVNLISFFANMGVSSAYFNTTNMLNFASLLGVVIGIFWNYTAAKIIFKNE